MAITSLCRRPHAPADRRRRLTDRSATNSTFLEYDIVKRTWRSTNVGFPVNARTPSGDTVVALTRLEDGRGLRVAWLDRGLTLRARAVMRPDLEVTGYVAIKADVTTALVAASDQDSTQLFRADREGVVTVVGRIDHHRFVPAPRVPTSSGATIGTTDQWVSFGEGRYPPFPSTTCRGPPPARRRPAACGPAPGDRHRADQVMRRRMAESVTIGPGTV